ncbi:esterase [Haematobacter missouriensis]|uniref:Esterase n=1 Tax=Haematobacter missouriensis TaxID=366616 RepID=A0A212AN80_9RHOB|nr:PHB depolymerase family esterase [Haematobacter missouriensis]KFI24278.1 esterase [Haematobacter missouriensis]OWJ75051.1 esterase [Haematobacter missouriensis]OWJ82756.1 esterase [Haematobacter missouriensis]
MKPLDLGALRRAIADARPGNANDLVRRTLAQHGLAADSSGAAATNPLSALSGMGARPDTAPTERPVPGARFDSGHFVCDAGGREYLKYVPASAANGAAGVIMMLHGCTQNGADFAVGTRMNALAEQHRLIIVYPRQSRGDNAQSCWNWFSPGDQRRGRGEPAILAGLASEISRDHDIPPARTFVAGLSAGAAMAVILGQTYDDVFAAVGAHSGLPFGSARDVPSAFAAMGGRAGEVAHRRDLRPTPTIIFQGSADQTVHGSNAGRIGADVLAAGPKQTLLDRISGQTNGRNFVRETTTASDGAVLLEHWTIEGLGHAWSGGNPRGTYSDPNGPDASAEMARFFLSLRKD